MAGRCCAVAGDGPGQNGTGLSSTAGHPTSGPPTALQWLPQHPALCISPAPGLQSMPCPLQDAQLSQVLAGQVTGTCQCLAEALSPALEGTGTILLAESTAP